MQQHASHLQTRNVTTIKTQLNDRTSHVLLCLLCRSAPLGRYGPRGLNALRRVEVVQGHIAEFVLMVQWERLAVLVLPWRKNSATVRYLLFLLDVHYRLAVWKENTATSKLWLENW